MGTLFVDKLDPQSGTSLEIGSSGDTITIPSGATITNSGTANGFGDTVFNTKGGCFTHGNQTSISSATYTKILLGTTVFNKGLTFGSNKVTIPSGEGGNYYISTFLDGNMYAVDKLQAMKGAIYINGSGSKYFGIDFRDNPVRDAHVSWDGVIALSAADYVEIYAYIIHTQSTTSYQAVNQTMLTMFKVNDS